MATFTFTATAPNGSEATRTTGSMPYVAVLMTADPGKDNWGPYSWHKTQAAAVKASQSSAHQGRQTEVVPAVPTSVQGKITVAEVADGWGDIPADVLVALVEATAAGKPKAKAEAPAKVTKAKRQPAPKAKAEGTIVIAAEADAAEVKRAKRRARRLARRAAETPEAKAERLARRRDRRAARKAAVAR